MSDNCRRLQQILEAHEIQKLAYNPIPGDPRRSDGFWIAIAYCKCGNASPPEHRANHLARVVAAAEGLTDD